MRKTIEIKVSPEMWAERTLHDGYVAAYRVEGGINKEYKFMGVRIEGFSTLVLVFGSHEPGEDETRSPVITELCDDRQQWISVKDRLPEEATDRFLVCDAFTKNQAVGFMSDGYINCWDDMFDDAITHWMPLPSPPEVDDV